MTDLLIDLASYQAGIDLSLPPFAPWNRINIKTSQGNWYVANRQRSRAWADQARALGKGISTFHWLDMSTSGADQARIAFAEMRALGGPDGMAHQADTEDNGKRFGPMTYRVWADYVNAMQDLLGRHVLNYTGDWWWQDSTRNWDGASLTPYLMAAPNAGYPGTYPGDQSDHWNAGYGGWDTLAAMQYAVGPIFNGGPGAGSVSMTAIRDPQVWAALTGNGGQDMSWNQDIAYEAIPGGPSSPDGKEHHEAWEWLILSVRNAFWSNMKADALGGKVDALTLKVDALAQLLAAGAGSPDLAGVIAHVDQGLAQLSAEESATVTELKARIDRLQAALASAGQASAGALAQG